MSNAQVSSAGSYMDILVTEDNYESRRLLIKQLSASGHAVRGVSNGEEALSLALEHPPQVLVTDILMPKMDGFQLCMEWKLNPKLRRIPVVFYSATYTSDEDERFALSLGADAFIRKPADSGEFVRVLSDLVEKAASGTALPGKVEPIPYSGFLTEHSKHLLTKLFSKVAQLESEAAERKQIEDQANLEAQLLDSATDMIYVADRDWRIQYANEASSANLGYAKEEMQGRDLRQFLAEDHAELLRESCDADATTFETSHVRKDGSVFPVEVRARTVDWRGQRVRLAIARDITERKKVEARLHASHLRLERVLQGTIAVVEQMIEARDPYTSGHQRRVAELAVAIARQMQLPEETCAVPIRTAAVIHDIGKITVPAEILSKPGRLTEAEFSLIRTHPQVGYDIIKRADLPDPIAEVVLQHHERLDGSGYPRGLSGDEILPEAQILAVADVVEAMSSHRPYRPALSVTEALEEVASGSGTRYYPDVVAACRTVVLHNGFAFSS